MTADVANAHSPPAQTAWHTLRVEEIAQRLGTDLLRGLTAAEANRRLELHGPNAFAESKTRSGFLVLVDQFRSMIVALLIAATAIAFVLGEPIEAIAILVVIVLNAAIGFATEWKAEQALAALRKQTVPVAQVIREGQERNLPAAELVPGDVVVLTAGARVPADGRVIRSVQLQIEEAPLTGESHAVSKITEPLADADVTLGDRVNMAFLGTAVASGRGRIVVTATGRDTEMGKIGKMIEEAADQETPLEQKLSQLGRTLVGIVMVLCAIIVVAGWARGNAFLYMLEVGISLAIAAVPEGLPAVTTMTLAIGMTRMARMKALVRRLPAVETLGSTTVICTDKTGTLTKNEMTIRAIQVGERRYEVTGTGYDVAGEFQLDGRRIEPKDDEHLLLALRVGALCNDAKIDRSDDQAAVLGDPTEAALLIVAEKAGLARARLHSEYPRTAEIPFSSESKRMITLHRTPDGKTVAYVKGAPGTLVEASQSLFTPQGPKPITPDDRKRLLAVNEELAGQALRVLALAYREVPEKYDDKLLGQDLVFIGLVGMIDPLREEAKAAIATCREAGIRTMMMTGDQTATASEIARQLGIDRDAEGRPLRTIHGRELVGADDATRTRLAAETSVFARLAPEHKLRIVESLQARGEIVAMTGDGVNDAPALKTADIGVAMGIKGTEVAKEASDMVLLDDNFATLVNAIEQGRIIYANILRFIHYLFSCNFAEILVVFIAIMIGWPLPLGALQILWLNMITDVFPALALALEPSAPDVMKRRPRDPRQPLVTPRFVGLIAWQGLLLAGLTLFAFFMGMQRHGADEPALRHAVTMAFMTLALAQVFHAFNARSQNRSIASRLFTNPWLWGAVFLCLALQITAVFWPVLQAVLGTVPLSWTDWAIVAGCSLFPIVVVEVLKAIRVRIR